MAVHLTIEGFRSQMPVSSLPVTLLEYAIPGSTVSGMTSPDGAIAAQYVAGADCTFVYVTARTAVAVRLVLQHAYTASLLLVAEGDLPGVPFHYCRLAAQAGRCEVGLPAGCTRLICLLADTGEPLPSGPFPVTAVMADLVYSLLHTPYIKTMEDFCQAAMRQLWLAALQAGKQPATPGRYAEDVIERLRKARSLVEKHLDRHFTISQLAQQAGLNRQLLKQGFKALFGTGPYAYLLGLRLDRAREQLLESRKPVKQISRQAGYRNAGNFSRAFRKKFGVSPYAYRAKQR